MGAVIIVSLLIFIAVLIWNFAQTDNSENGGLSTVVLALVSVWVTAMTIAYFESKTPSAMDVYKGKTTLEITYRDSVAIDSTVVFKEK